MQPRIALQPCWDCRDEPSQSTFQFISAQVIIEPRAHAYQTLSSPNHIPGLFLCLLSVVPQTSSMWICVGLQCFIYYLFIYLGFWVWRLGLPCLRKALYRRAVVSTLSHPLEDCTMWLAALHLCFLQLMSLQTGPERRCLSALLLGKSLYPLLWANVSAGDIPRSGIT